MQTVCLLSSVQQQLGPQHSSRYLANVAQLIPGLARPVLAGRVDPVLHFCQASLHIFPIAEAAALPPQQQLVKQLHIHKAEELLEQLPHLQQPNSIAVVGILSLDFRVYVTSRGCNVKALTLLSFLAVSTDVVVRTIKTCSKGGESMRKIGNTRSGMSWLSGWKCYAVATHIKYTYSMAQQQMPAVSA